MFQNLISVPPFAAHHQFPPRAPFLFLCPRLKCANLSTIGLRGAKYCQSLQGKVGHMPGILSRLVLKWLFNTIQIYNYT